ncbi:MAG: translocation/assembly module TamB domain-containing protein, partial [Bacteroidia bacterium]
MIQNIKIVFKRILKIILWITLSVILLLLCLGVIIRIPSVQHAVLVKTTDYLQKKTHAEIKIKKIELLFPTSISLEGVLVKDLARDTLISAGEITLNLDMLGLIKKKVNVSHVLLSDIYVNLNRNINDSLFNFNFFTTAFTSATNKKVVPDTTKQTSPQLTVKEITLKNIRFIYDDKYTGVYASSSFSSLNLTTYHLDLTHQRYIINELNLTGLRGNVEIRKKSENFSVKKKELLPFISAKKINLNNCSFSFADNISGQSVISVISKLGLSSSSIDLNSEKIIAGDLFIGQSNVRINTARHASEHPVNRPHETGSGIQHGWNILANSVQFENNSLGYNIVNMEQKRNSFDYNHINYDKVSLKAQKIFYSANKMYATIQNFSALNPLNLQVKEFSTQFIMTGNSIDAQYIHLKTDRSVFDGDAGISYTSLENIADSISNLKVKAKIRNSSIYPKEIAHFAPQLNQLPFFLNSRQTMVTGEISGTIGKLKAKNIILKTGSSTVLQTDFAITGLLQPKQSYFDINKFALKTSREDIIALAGAGVFPKIIHLPNELSLTGIFKGYFNEFITAIDLQSSFGNFAINGNIDKSENFKGTINSRHFDLGSLLNNKKLFGPVTFTAAINGHGLDTQTVKASVDITAGELYLNQYTYHNLILNGTLSKKIVEGHMTIKDTNIVLDINGYVNLNKGVEQYKINLNLEGADLKKLNLTDKDLKIAFRGISDLRGSDMNTINGTAGITQIIVVSKGKKYILDSLIFAAINEKGNNQITLSSALIGIKYNGTFAPGDLVKELKQNIDSYFPIENIDSTVKKSQPPQQFSFEVILHNHPILSEVFLPDLKEFEPGKIQGSYSTEKKQLLLDLSIDRLLYKNYDINSLVFKTNSDENKLTYKLTCQKISNTRFKFDNVLIEGKIENATIFTHIASTDENGDKKLTLSTLLAPFNNDYKLSIDPTDFFVVNEQWTVSPDNYIVFGKEGFWFHDLRLTKTQNEVFFNTIPATFSGETRVGLKNLALDDFSRIIEKDTGIVKGLVNGNINLRKIKNTFGFESDFIINSLKIHEIAVGDLHLKADNKTSDKYNLDISLTGGGNNVNVKGFYNPVAENQVLDLDLELNPLTAQSLEAFSFGKVRDASGNISGNFKIKGNFTAPDLTGSLLFDNVTLTPAILNSQLFLRHETFKIQPDGFTFNSFTMLDKNQNPAVIDGNISMNHFSEFKFNLTVNTTNFLLLNTTVKDNEQYFGTMIVDSRIRVHGTPAYPIINSSVKLKNGSNFTFAVTEDKLTTDRGENVVLFIDSMKFNPILTRNENREKKKSALKDFDISSSIEIDRKAGIRLLLDPGTNDSLVVRGEAALSFALDPSGKVSLTGVYNLSEGVYVVSLENLIRKKFNIQPGSTITWNGDPLDALININATYYIRTSPVDLVAGQVTSAELGNYRQRYPFLVLLKLRGALLTPDITFEIQLQQSDKGAVGGTINAKLEQLNDNPSSLNKQVFALLVLNRFVQENPLQTETNASENAARTTVGKMLSAQLNQLSSKLVPGVDINFDVESYDDYSSGKS